jgi:hypothetical protein
VIDEMKRVIVTAGFNVDENTWEAYKKWEQGMLKTFR